MKVIALTSNKESSNSYLLIKEQSGLLIDGGASVKALIKQVEQLHISLKAILLTHGHFDHLYAVSEIASLYQIPVYAHYLEEEVINDPRYNGTKIFDIDLNINIKITGFNDDEQLNIDPFTIMTIMTPFHTHGSVCYYIKEEGLLFTGDTLFKGSIGRSDLPTGSFRTINSSLDKLKILPATTIVYPGHGPKTTIGYEKQFNRYFNR